MTQGGSNQINPECGSFYRTDLVLKSQMQEMKNEETQVQDAMRQDIAAKDNEWTSFGY